MFGKTARVAAAALTVAVTAAGCARCKDRDGESEWTQPAPAVPAAASVWVVDDSVRIGRRDGPIPILAGESNAVWSPGKPIALFGLPGETVAIQVGVTAGPAPVRGVTVELERLEGPEVIENRAPGPPDPSSWHPIERFVLHDLVIERRSGGETRGESLGWSKGSQPPDRGNRGLVPDPMIPIALAPSWCDYPMTVSPGEHRIVWIDITLDEGLPAGEYHGTVSVRAAERELASIPVALEVGGRRIPYAAVRTMLFHSADVLAERVGGAEAERHYLQLVHRHHITPFYLVNSTRDLDQQRAQLTGALYTAEHGYSGPGVGRGDDLISLGTYGSLGDPEPETVATVEAIVRRLAASDAANRDIFLYAVDEQCESDRAPAWRRALDRSPHEAVRELAVAHTCSEDPASQPVDLAIVFAPTYDPARAAAARARGKRVWVYNGALPRTGTFLTDGDPLSLRANAWLQSIYGVERWFYWESTFWHDGNRGGHGPYDPWTVAETFHNQDGDHANGDGVLVYPGQQPGFPGGKSLGFAGVLPSFRLKQWRRGIQDAGYLQLARTVDREAADRIARDLIGKGFSEAPKTGSPTWPRDGARYTEARRALFDLFISR